MRLQVISMRGNDLGDLRTRATPTSTPARASPARTSTRRSSTATTASLPLPNYPFTWLKPVPVGGPTASPWSRSGSRSHGRPRGAGTNDDVFLRLSEPPIPARQAPLRRLRARRHRHLQRPDRRAVTERAERGDIQFVQIEKSRDGVAGRVAPRRGVVWVNDRQVYSKDTMNRWPEKSRRECPAPLHRHSVRDRPGGPGVHAALREGRPDPRRLRPHRHQLPGTGARTQRSPTPRGQRCAPGTRWAEAPSAGASTTASGLSWKLQTFFPSVATIAPSPSPGPGVPICASRPSTAAGSR